MFNAGNEIELIYGRQVVGQSVLVSGTHMGPATVVGLLFCSALSDERMGL
jgi:hypothetical protein